jgi:hypothetical protein
VADAGGEDLLVGVEEWDLLHLDADTGVAALEVGHQILDHLPFAAQSPEMESDAGVLPRAAGDDDHQRDDQELGPAAQGAVASSSQPPVKPARFKPRMTWGFLRIAFQTRPLR